MGKLKIGFILDDTLDTPDGVQQYVLTLGKWMVEQGHDVHYLVGHTIRTDIANVHSIGRNIKVRFNGNRMSTPLPASKKVIRQLLAREKFDILHVQVPYSPFLAGRIIAAAPQETAVVGTFHIAPHSNFVTLGNRVLSVLCHLSLRRFNAIFSVSQAAADFANHIYGISSTIIPNVVNADDFKKAKPFSTTKGVATIVYLGRLVPRKGCAVLLEAVKLLHDQPDVPPFKVIVCGGGPLETELQQYVHANDLDTVVSFTSFVTEADKARYLKTADISVFPSLGGESFGIVLLEAMAAEHPVVLAADNPGYHTVMAPRPDLLFPVSSSQALSKKLLFNLQHLSEQHQALEWQKQYVRSFDVSVVGSRLVARYMEALRLRRGVR